MELKYIEETKSLSGLLLFYDNDCFEVRNIEVENLNTIEIKEKYKRLLLMYSVQLKDGSNFYIYDKEKEMFYINDK